MLGWHWTTHERRLRTGVPIIEGMTYSVPERELSLGRFGLHACRSALDALGYGPGPVLSRVELSGKIIERGDKLCASRRRHLWIRDQSEALERFTRAAARAVLHLWSPPAALRSYLEVPSPPRRLARKVATTYAAGDNLLATWEWSVMTACASLVALKPLSEAASAHAEIAGRVAARSSIRGWSPRPGFSEGNARDAALFGAGFAQLALAYESVKKLVRSGIENEESLDRCFLEGIREARRSQEAILQSLIEKPWRDGDA